MNGNEPNDGAGRLVSLDAYRGFIMLTMASGGLGLMAISRKIDPPSPLWDFLGYQFDHVEWEGCAFWDLIQPSFMFMVGVAMPFSLAARAAKGDSWGWQFAHAVWRAAVLILLAVFLSSPQSGLKGPTTQPLTNWVFTNVLAQIGLGYVFLFLLAGRGIAVQAVALVTVLAGYTALFAAWPVAGPEYDWAKVGVPSNFPRYDGFFAHWNKNANAAHAFDLWFLNLFPRVEEFKFNSGGYQTLNFVPSLATMIFGLMAGEMLRSGRSKGQKFAILALAAAACLAVGYGMGLGVTPVVKRIWTPSWAVYSTGWTFAILAAFFAVIDVLGFKAWTWPLVVVGMNSIAMYVMSQLIGGWVRSRWGMLLGSGTFDHLYGPLVLSLLTLGTLWLICVWLYRRKVFLRI
ncbi:MAG: acyltransferase family protein [Gemmataceae bacterium]